MDDRNATLASDEIDRIIGDGQTYAAQQAQKIFTRDGVLCLSLEASELVAAAEKITKYPSKYRMDAYKEMLRDERLVCAINDPYVKLALQLKQSFDLGKLSLFPELMLFSGTRTISEDPIVSKFSQECKFYLPPLPYIRDDDLRSREASQELYAVGRAKFLSVVDELLFIRFPEQDIMKDIMTYVSCKHTASTWATWYELVDPDQHQEIMDTTPDELFYNYFGALVLSNTLPSDEVELVSTVSILIEPIVRQFDEDTGMATSQSAKDELQQQIPGVNYECIHGTSHASNAVTLCHAYGGDNAVLLGMGYGHTREEAENRAAMMALYKKSHLDRALQNINTIANYVHVEEEDDDDDVPTQEAQEVYEEPYSQLPVAYVPAIAPPPPLIGLTMALVTIPTNDDQVPLAPNLPDEAVDKSCKHKLNDLLLELRYATAEWKTTKISNSDVQVMCTIENVKVARCVSTNKMKAGQLCAQFILNDWRNLLKGVAFAHR